MRRLIFTFTFFILHFSFCTLHSLPAFPGAEGWASEITGGRGGQVMIVTNLNDNGIGSLRMALQSRGKRIIVFRVSGVINCMTMNTVNRYIDLDAIHSDFMVAGQTSPGGITLYGTRRAITGSYREPVNNFIFRFLRFRVNADGQGTDCVEFNAAHHFIFDHCDFSGGTDGCLDISNGKDYILQWTTIANSAYCCTDHGGSILANYEADRISIHHNVWAHHESRCGGWINGVTQIKFDYRNNICYNGVTYLFAMGAGCTAPIYLNVVGNTFIAGPNTPASSASQERVWGQVSLGAAQAYEDDNLFIGITRPDTNWLENNRIGEYVNTPHDMPAVTTYPQVQAYDTVLDKVGAWPRDSMNVRTMQEIRTQTGFHKNDTAPLVQDGPVNDPADNAADHDNDGYMNIEEYINDLALARLCRDYYNPIYPIPNNWDDYNPSCCGTINTIESPGFRTEKAPSLSIQPNPFSGVALSIKSRNGQGLIKIFNLNGRLVREFQAGRDIIWLGRDNSGAKVSPGTYIVRMVYKGRVKQERKIVILR
jgi:hypothetical protein